MSNTKFIKVAVSDSGQFEDNKSYYYITGWGEITKDVFISDVDFTEYSYRYKFFLQEVPDRESELIEMLDSVKELFNRKTFPREIEMITYANEIDSLIQSVKQPK